MLTLHLIPVGLSLLEKIRWEGELPALRPALAVDQLPGSADTVREALRLATGPNHELDLNHLGLAAAHRTTVAADTALAAEWTSVAAVAGQRRHGEVNGEAHVLIATDTDDGLRAATLLAARYQPTIRYLDEPLAAGRPVLEPGDVYVCRIPHLDLGYDRPSDNTWRSLGAVGRLAVDTVTGLGEWNAIVHLSGGYKAMIPYLMEMAEGVHTLLRAVPRDEYRPGVRTVVVHESSLQPGRGTAPVVIDVPVRAIEGDLLADARELAAAARPDSDIVRAGVAEELTGLLIEWHGEQTRQLTPAGLIMVTML